MAKAIDTDGNEVADDTLSQLAATHLRQGQPQKAVQLLLDAIQAGRSSAVVYSDLGVAYRALGQLERSLEAYRKALEIDHQHMPAHMNMANALRANGRESEAESQLRLALQIRPTAQGCRHVLAQTLRQQDRVDEALEQYEQASELHPGDALAIEGLGDCLRRQGRLTEAVQRLEQAEAMMPDQQRVRLKREFAMPVILESQQQIDEVRKRIHHGLDALIANPPNLDIYREFQVSTFDLAYHGLNDRELQSKFGRLKLQIDPSLAFVADHCRGTAPRSSEDGRIRVGFVSNYFYSHTVTKLTLGLIRELDRTKFHVSVFAFPHLSDSWRDSVQQSADRFCVLPSQLQAAREQIAAEKLDILFYPDIGMDRLTNHLAFARLAPVQCVTWGHPVTTGIPNIDYFVSNEYLEPEDAANHYSESLILLKHLPTYYFPLTLSTEDRALQRSDLGLPDDAHVYLCPQSLFKLHPDLDLLFGEILRRDPKGRIFITQSSIPTWERLILERLQRNIPDVADRVSLLSRMPTTRYVRAMEISEVLLDPILFGGGNTTFEALSVGAPIVTWPGPQMRSRVTYACYRQMGLDDCIAAGPESYVDLAVGLATDPKRREAVRKRILEAAPRLFENPDGVRELEEFFLASLEKTHV